jgi:hypothetical protein
MATAIFRIPDSSFEKQKQPQLSLDVNSISAQVTTRGGGTFTGVNRRVISFPYAKGI